MTDDPRQATRRRRAAAMVCGADWCTTDDYKPEVTYPEDRRRDESGPLPGWMVVTCWSDDHTTMFFAYFYDTQERAFADLRGLLMAKGETPEHLLDLDTGTYRDILMETVFTLADTFSGDPDEEEEEEE